MRVRVQKSELHKLFTSDEWNTKDGDEYFEVEGEDIEDSYLTDDRYK